MIYCTYHCSETGENNIFGIVNSDVDQRDIVRRSIYQEDGSINQRKHAKDKSLVRMN